MKSVLLVLGSIFLSFYSLGQQVLGNFTGQDQLESPVVIWYRDAGNGWDEGLIKNSSTLGNP